MTGRFSLLKLYLKDRWGLIAVYYAGALLPVLVALLGRTAPVSANARDALYGAGLSTILLAAYLAHGFLRQERFLRDLVNLVRPESPMEEAALVSAPATHEQKAFCDALAAGYGRFRGILIGYAKAEEMHRRFADRWVHHMKTPVSVMKLLIEQLRGCVGSVGSSEGRASEIALDMERENQRLQRGLDTFLSAARLEGFESDLHVEQVNLVEIARESLNAHKSEMIGSSVFPKLEIAVSSPLVATDRKWIRFVLDQLITNGVKYRGPLLGGGVSKALTVSIAQNAAEYRLAVRDEGIGIPPEDLPRVFDPFFTGRNGRLAPESTGMGLYLVRQVLHRLGHTIEVDSSLGKGSVFTVTFASGSIADGMVPR